jgi:hypothetical protein
MRMTEMLRATTLFALMLAAQPSLAARADADRTQREAGDEGEEGGYRLRARAWPAYSRAPAVLRIEMLVSPNEENRALEIVLESGDYLRSSVIALEGADAARFHVVSYRSVPAGSYTVQVGLRGRSGSLRATEHQVLEVIE